MTPDAERLAAIREALDDGGVIDGYRVCGMREIFLELFAEIARLHSVINSDD